MVAAKDASDGAGALSGLRVVEIGGPAAALAGRYLAGYGAEVIKIEPPGGDRWRLRPPFCGGKPNPDAGALFLYLNAGKQSMVVDPTNEPDRTRLRRLVEQADALVVSGTPSELDAYGLRFEELARTNPRLVYTIVTPFGLDGPARDRPATNLSLYALGGQMSLTGEPFREPLVNYGYQSEYQAGLNAFSATLALLLAAGTGGRGDRIEISMQECMAATNELYAPRAAYTGLDAQRRGNTNSAHWSIYPCADGYAGVWSLDRNWPAVARAIGMPELATDPRFRDAVTRLEHDDELQAIMYAWFLGHTQQEIYRLNVEQGAPFGYTATPADLFTSEQLVGRGFFDTVEHPVAGRLSYPGRPFPLVGGWRPGLAPVLGGSRQSAVGSREAMQPAPSSVATTAATTPPTVSAAVDAAVQAVDPTTTAACRLPPAARALPLSGIRVTDLTMVWAGPYATKLLADWGADVVKVESVFAWDLLRTLVPPIKESGEAAPPDERNFNKSNYFNEYNRNKRGVTLHLAAPEGRKQFLDLVACSDVVIENYRSDVMEKLGLTYDVLRAVRPDIIYVSMAGFGKSGPERGMSGYGPLIEQLSGLTAFTGYVDDDRPIKTGISYGDPVGGITAAGAALAALIHRDRTGEGQFIDLAQRETMSCLLGEAFLDWSANRQPRPHTGNRDLEYAPQGCYPCAGEDRWVTLTVRDDRDWQGLLQALGEPAWGTDARFADADGRRRHHDELDERIAAWTRGRTPDEAMDALTARGVPGGAVRTMLDLLSDKHLAARGFYERFPHPEAGGWPQGGPVWQLASTPVHIRRAAPLLGEHNAEVLAGLLGTAPDELERLAAMGQIGSVPVRPSATGTASAAG